MANEITLKDLEEYKQFYFEKFGEETNLDKGRGSISTHFEAIIEAINTDTPIPRFPDDLTDADT